MVHPQSLYRYGARGLLRALHTISSSEKLTFALAQWLLEAARRVPSEPGLREQVNSIFRAVAERHPAARLVHRMARQLHPSYLDGFIWNVFGRQPWLGDDRSTRFEQKYGLSPPRLWVFSPTNRCNLRCLGCYSGAYDAGSNRQELDVGTLDRLVSELKSYGTSLFVISGGEPMLVWDRTVEPLLERHRDAAFLMYTNGTLITEQRAQRMLELGNLAPAISLEGFADKTNQRRGNWKGKSVFDVVSEKFDLLRSKGIFFGASVTYTSLNWDEATRDEFYQFLLDKGCIFAWYFMYVPIGRMPDKNLMCTPEQRAVVRDRNWRALMSKGMFIADFWNLGCLTHGCIAAGRYGHVNHMGDIEPCVFIKYATRNVRDGSRIIDALLDPLFVRIRDGDRHRNPLSPCTIVDNPWVLREAVETSGARPTEEGQEILGSLHEWLMNEYSPRLRQVADEAWLRPKGDYDFDTWRRYYSMEPGWLMPGTAEGKCACAGCSAIPTAQFQERCKMSPARDDRS